jgi:predicted Rossmann-fold nucleotide-binding protein
VLVGKEYWKGLVDWITNVMLLEEQNIKPDDLELFSLVDEADEAIEIINQFYSKYMLSPNF